MSARVDVAVIGGGVFGQTIAWQLALRGRTVALVEPYGPGHGRSASGDHNRIVRAFYGEPFFARSAWASMQLWEEWSQKLGSELVTFCGALYLEEAGDGEEEREAREWADQACANLRALGGTAVDVEPAEAARRWPALSPRGLQRVVYEPFAGAGRASSATRRFALAAQDTGRVQQVHGAAVRLLVKGSSVTGAEIRAPRAARGGTVEKVSAGAVVVAAGYEGAVLVNALLEREALQVQKVQHWCAYWDVPYPGGAELRRSALPAWNEPLKYTYGVPDDGEHGFKCGLDTLLGSKSVAPPPPTPATLSKLRSRVARRFPSLALGSVREVYECSYDATPDGVFQIGPVPGVERLFFVGGLSGHGFKHAPSLGSSVAAALCGEPPLVPLEPYQVKLAPRPPGRAAPRG